VKPSRAIGAYIYFNTEMCAKLKEKEGISHKEAFAKAGKMWGELSEKDKEPYNKKAEEDKARYESKINSANVGTTVR
jgi:hypothetical protein